MLLKVVNSFLSLLLLLLLFVRVIFVRLIGLCTKKKHIIIIIFLPNKSSKKSAPS